MRRHASAARLSTDGALSVQPFGQVSAELRASGRERCGSLAISEEKRRKRPSADHPLGSPTRALA